MKIWFLRFSPDDVAVSAAQLRMAKLAPILFRNIPFKECSLDLSEDEVRNLVDVHYGDSSPGRRGQFVGAMTRFLRDLQVGDVVAICLNRESRLHLGEIMDGPLREFPNITNSKARPVRWLTDEEIATLKLDTLPASAKKYSGTICLWSDADIPDDDESQKDTFYERADPGVRQIKFIRVGADLGCGGRLSRLFPQNYYHFIPIPKHNDPEFCRFTYGDVNHALKFRSLLNLRFDDILVFYAGFESEHEDADGRPVRHQRVVGIFAYFVVREVYLFDRRAEGATALKTANLPRGDNLIAAFTHSATKDAFKELIAYCGDYNEHAGIEECDSLQLVVCGDRKQSRLLRNVKILAEANSVGKYILDDNVAAHWGLKPGADLTRCSVRTVEASMVGTVADHLQRLP